MKVGNIMLYKCRLDHINKFLLTNLLEVFFLLGFRLIRLTAIVADKGRILNKDNLLMFSKLVI